jgi:DNA-binding NtrC family response regulator
MGPMSSDAIAGRRKRPRQVLLVEADAFVAKLLGRELERRYRVISVGSMTAALQCLRSSSRQRIIAVVTNHSLGYGRREGAILLAHVAKRWPAIGRIIYGEKPLSTATVSWANTVVAWPVTFDALLAAVERIDAD